VSRIIESIFMAESIVMAESIGAGAIAGAAVVSIGASSFWAQAASTTAAAIRAKRFMGNLLGGTVRGVTNI
jgi:hypothetical protein